MGTHRGRGALEISHSARISRERRGESGGTLTEGGGVSGMSASATAHQRSISTFVDEYSGVVGLYSHLAQCWRHQPPFLRRNLACRRDTYEGERLELNGNKKIGSAGDNAATSRQERGGKGGSSGASSAQAGKSKKPTSDAKDVTTGRKSVHTGKGMVIYRFRFNEGLQECVQKKNDFQCVWCDATWASLDDLTAHLAATHDRLDHTLVNSTPPEIYVSVVKKAKRIHIHEDLTYVSANRGVSTDMSSRIPAESSVESSEAEEEGADDNGDFDHQSFYLDNEAESAVGKKRGRPPKVADNGSKSSLKGTAGKRGGKGKEKAAPKGFHDRTYYRSQTCLKIHPDDMDYDSDDDVDDEWQIQHAEELMDEFVDVTDKEKTLMKLWNRFVHKHAILADFHVPEAAKVFTQHHVAELVEKNLRDELLLHMFALWDFNLICKEQILDIISIVDDYTSSHAGSSSKGHDKGGSSSRG